MMTAIDSPAAKSLLVALDEQARARSESALAGIAIWLQHVFAAFDRNSMDQVQRLTLSKLSARVLTDDEETAELMRLLEEKQREQELQRLRSTPWEGR